MGAKSSKRGKAKPPCEATNAKNPSGSSKGGSASGAVPPEVAALLQETDDLCNEEAAADDARALTDEAARQIALAMQLDNDGDMPVTVTEADYHDPYIVEALTSLGYSDQPAEEQREEKAATAAAAAVPPEECAEELEGKILRLKREALKASKEGNKPLALTLLAEAKSLEKERAAKK